MTPRLAIGSSKNPNDDVSAVAAGDVALTDLSVDLGQPERPFGVANRLASELRP